MPGWVNFQSATLDQFCIGGNTFLWEARGQRPKSSFNWLTRSTLMLGSLLTAARIDPFEPSDGY